jgi:integrase
LARPVKHDGGLFKRTGTKVWWMQYRNKAGERQRESTGTEDWDEAQRPQATFASQGQQQPVVFAERTGTFIWGMVGFLSGELFQTPFRALKTHQVNQSALKHLRTMFENTSLAELTADDIEMYLRLRLKQRVQVKTGSGFISKGPLKATTVHQELRVLRRMLNVAVRKKFVVANPCSGVEFPARVDRLFRPHYMGWSEQQKIEFNAPEYLKNVIRIITETGLRVYKELTPMRKEHLDLENGTVWIPDSKTVNGVAEVPLTEIAVEAFRRQLVISGPGPFLFPSEGSADGYRKMFKTVWHATLRRAGVRYFRIYDLRSTYATRLSAG